ncbi:MAG: hypothetical protein ABMA64_31970, partial [Myxococcota bacterium]
VSGVVVGRGGFRVDRKLGLEKMAKFQLEDPYRYVLELVAAAVCAGATAIDIDNDSDDFVIRWSGALPTQVELEGLFDHLFGDPDDARGQMLQHLAVGALGATGLSPRWLRIDRAALDDEPAVRLEVRDPTETPVVPLTDDPPEGVRVSVREQLGAATLAEAVQLLFRPPLEARLIQGAARHCPAPIRINGQPVDRAIPDHAVRVTDGWLWLGAPSVEVVRHGVVVGHASLPPLAGTPVGGVLFAGAVRLNASRSEVVDDGRWTDARAALVASHREWLRHGAFGGSTALGLAALDQLGEGPFGALADLPLVAQVAGRGWSVAELSAMDPPPRFARDHLDQVGSDVVFGPPHVDRVLRLRPDAVGYDDVLAARARVAAMQRRKKERPYFTSGRQRRFTHGPLQGAVKADSGGARGPLVVSLRRDGVVVETTWRPGPGPKLEAILDHPGFTPNPTWDRVVPDAVRTAAEEALELEIRRFLVELTHDLPPDDAVELVTNCLRLTDRGYAPLDPELAPITAAPIVATGDGRRLSIDEVLAGDYAVAESSGPIPDALLRRCVRIPAPVREEWRRWLGVERTADWLADLSRGQREAAPRRAPVLRAPVDVRVPVDAAGITGELGASPDGTGAAELVLTRCGVELCTLRAPLALPGVRGALDLAEDWPVDRAHQALVSPAAVLERLGPALRALALALWRHTGTPGPAVCGWLRSVGWDPDARDRRIGAWGDGLPAALGDARRAPVPVALSTSRPHPWVAAPDVLCVEPHVLALLRHLERDRFVDGTAGVDAWNRHAVRFEQQAPLGRIPTLAERVAELGGVDVWFGLPSDPARIGEGRIEVVHRDRLVATIPVRGAAPVVRVALEPDRTFTRPRDHAPVRAIEEAIPDALYALVQAATATPEVWLALRARLGAGPTAEVIDGEPIVPCFGGLRSLREVAAEPQVVLAVGVPPGPSPFPLVVQSSPQVEAAVVAAVGFRPPDRSADIRAWREGQARRKLLPVRSLTVSGPHRRWFEAEGLRGEFGLGTGAGGMLAEVVLDGVELAPEGFPFPVPVRAVVTGDALEADLGFVRLTPAGREQLRALVDLAHAYARGLLAGWRPTDDRILTVWLREYVLSPEATADAPLFRCADGTWIDRAELDRRQAEGGVAMTHDPRARVPGGPAPVWVDDVKLGTLATRYRLVLVGQQAPTPLPALDPSAAVPLPRRGAVGFCAGDGVFLRVDGLRGPRIPVEWPTPLDGWVEDPAVRVKPTGDGLVPGPSVDALCAAVRAAALAATDQLCGSRRPADLQRLRRSLEASIGSPAELRDALDSPETSIGRWADAPLYPDGEGELCSARALVVHLPVRRVPPGTTDARPAPGRPRFWALEDDTVRWLDRVASTRDAAREAAEERAGNARRAGPKHPRPPTPAGARVIELGQVSGRVWPGVTGITVLCGGVWVGQLHPGVAEGWLEGPLADVALSRVELPSGVQGAVDDALVAAWAAEGPAAWPRRFAQGVP